MKALWVSLVALSFAFGQGNVEYQIDPKPVLAAMKGVGATQMSLALIRDDEVAGTQTFGPASKQVYQVGFLSRIPALMILLQM
ncbi:MAG: hypothetical protein K8R88_10405, partial [Armatimonadetes bacterium]|nr:hypothetical protein [Armatimonadota bacterium]